MMNAQPLLTDEELELAIHAAHRRLCDAFAAEQRMEHYREMCRLIAQRTPERVEQMEREAGLR